MLKVLGLGILAALLIAIVVMTSFIIAMAISLGICNVLIKMEETIKKRKEE